jgi:hypothetical protein
VLFKQIALTKVKEPHGIKWEALGDARGKRRKQFPGRLESTSPLFGLFGLEMERLFVKEVGIFELYSTIAPLSPKGLCLQ